MTAPVITCKCLKRHQKTPVLLYTWRNILLFISYVSSGFLKNPKRTCALPLKQAKLTHKITLWRPWKIDRKLISEQSVFTTGNTKI